MNELARKSPRRWLWRVLAVFLAGGLVAAGSGLPGFVRGLLLVVRAADLSGVWRTLADADTFPVTEHTVSVPLGAERIPTRVYTPVGRSRQTVVLVSGLHPAGVDEARLKSLARKLSEAGVTVFTPDIPELRRFEISSTLTDRIEAVAVWVSDQARDVDHGRIGLMGISFSGGLSVVAAGRPSLRDRLRYVFSLGGHDDLSQVMAFFCRGIEEGDVPPHDYGLAIVLLTVADRLVPPEQSDALRDGVRRFLWASYLDVVDKEAAGHEFRALRELARTLPEPAATLMTYVNDRDVVRLGPRLRPHLASYAKAAALSPARSPLPSVPVFLLHGRDDTVIPASESERLAARFGTDVPVHLLVTPLISHAAADQPARVLDVLRLGRFWGDLLEQ